MLPLGVLFSHHWGRGARGVVEAVVVGSLVSAAILVTRAIFLLYRRPSALPGEQMRPHG